MSFKKLFYICFCFLSLQTFCQKKTYHKAYYQDGKMKEEGWVKGDQKNGYWKFYHENGNIKSEGRFKNNLETKYWSFYRANQSKEKEGHFLLGKQNKWWLYYDDMGHINHKCQLKNNQKNGYCFIYKMEKMVKASKYQNGKKIKEWTDFKSFRKENSLSDLN
tara:strand:- start:6218 stop:6703 length:486 start_codon:yes stop_codon:yes gene_type:complete